MLLNPAKVRVFYIIGSIPTCSSQLGFVYIVWPSSATRLLLYAFHLFNECGVSNLCLSPVSPTRLSNRIGQKQGEMQFVRIPRNIVSSHSGFLYIGHLVGSYWSPIALEFVLSTASYSKSSALTALTLSLSLSHRFLALFLNKIQAIGSDDVFFCQPRAVHVAISKPYITLEDTNGRFGTIECT